MRKSDSGGSTLRRFGCGLGIVALVAILLALLSVGPYTEYLWYSEDAGYVRVFTLQYTVKALLFALGLFVTWGFLGFGLNQALKYKFVYAEVPEGPLKNITNMLMLIQRYGGEAVRIIAPLVGVIAGFSLSGEWQTMLLATHAHPFGHKDPVFGWDYAFFVFQLPWLSALLDWITALIFLVALLNVLVAAGLKVMQKVTPIEANMGQVIRRATVFGGLALIVVGIRVAFGCLDYGTVEGAQFVGAGYSAVIQLQATFVLGVMVSLLGAAVMISRNLALAWKGGAVCGAVLIIMVGLVPAVVQRIHVEPDKNHVEAPFAERALTATRYAYDLNGIDVRDMPNHDEPTPAEIDTAKGTFNNMRLWDPAVLQEAIEQLQSFKPYYAFNDVDIDRYQLIGQDGKLHQKMVMLSPRDISTPGLGDAAQTWVNTRLVYTHGYGVVVAPVNTANALGQPDPIVRDLPVQSTPDLPDTQPQIYFSDFRLHGAESESYAIVNTRVDEFDYPTQNGDAFHRWTGKTGVRIDGLATRIAFSIALGDGNLLVTNNLQTGSRLLLHRGIVDRATRQYPFLSFDQDPYMVLLDGHQVWVLDGYTTTDRIPYSSLISFDGKGANYVRNSVKIAIDAYSGQMTAYAVRPDDPILQAYEDIYPGLIHPASEVPSGLREHFRYPEDLFSAQSLVLCTYHVTDPMQFLSNVDSWSIPTERDLKGGNRVDSRPYYIEMRLPDGPKDEFLLMRGFTPYTRDNLSGWLAAHCDGADYGKLTLYLFSKGATVPGPWQVENLFVQDQRVAEVNRQFNNDQSQIVVGNLLVVPVGQSIVYAESLFLRGNAERGIPELRRVVLGVKNRIEIGDTYADALAKLFHNAPPPISPPTLSSPRKSTMEQKSPQPLQNVYRVKLEAVAKLLDDADSALRKGDFGTYGELQKKARAQLRELAGGQ